MELNLTKLRILTQYNKQYRYNFLHKWHNRLSCELHTSGNNTTKVIWIHACQLSVWNFISQNSWSPVTSQLGDKDNDF